MAKLGEDIIGKIHKSRRKRCVDWVISPVGPFSMDCVFKVNGMVALTKKIFPGGGGGFLLHLRSTSALTNMDYLCFSILCPDATESLVDELISCREVFLAFDKLQSDEAIASRDLLDILSWIRIVQEGARFNPEKGHRISVSGDGDVGSNGGSRAKRSRVS